MSNSKSKLSVEIGTPIMNEMNKMKNNCDKVIFNNNLNFSDIRVMIS